MLTLNFNFKNFSDEEKEELENYINKKIQRITRLLNKDKTGESRLEIRAERFATKAAYKITLTLHGAPVKILASEDDHTIREAVDLALDKLITQLKKSLEK